MKTIKKKKTKKKQQPFVMTPKKWLIGGGSVIAIIAILSAIVLYFSPEPIVEDDWWNQPPQAPVPVVDDTTVATMNGLPVRADDVAFWVSEAKNNVDSSDEQAVREEAARLAALRVLFEEYAAQNDIHVSEEDLASIDEHIFNTSIDYTERENSYEDDLRIGGIQGEAHLRHLSVAFALHDSVIQSILNDEEAFAQFEHLLEDEEELLGAKHILVNFDNHDGEDEVERIATELLARALAGEDFDMLIREYGEDPGMERNPDGYTFTSGAMVESFEQGTRELEIGEISGLVPSSFGIHIIKRVEPNPNNEVMRPWGEEGLTLEHRMRNAINRGFELKLESAELILLDELNDVPVSW
jgi:hypothetical protein